MGEVNPLSYSQSNLVSPLSFITCAIPHLFLSPTSLSFIMYSFILPLSHSIFASPLYLPHFNFVPIHLDLSARLSHKQHCYIVCIHNQRKIGEKKAFSYTYVYIFVYDSIMIMKDLSHCMFTSSPSPPILCSFTLSLHLCLPSFPLRNLLGFFQ